MLDAVPFLNIGLNWCKKRRSFAAALLPRLFGDQVVPASHVTRVGFELATNCIQFDAIANLDKTFRKNVTDFPVSTT